ncbi:1-aminocyclopropane-1-carboxylate deaminase/D-cysteine desulfhydrase [Thalassotalea litorea]|uniref:1-aminocyclopropane-1-carboxylate deaminase/D-cysteine desulfhydrase n=1 Tax=Thalassotalea litorea TaxID=2020715 RepID=UPI003736D7AB
MAIDLALPSPLQAIEHPLLLQKQVNVWVKRDDLIHPIISGNKWRKLSANLKACKNQGATQIVSFGGAFSNHIHALAFAGQQLGLQTVGVIRGEPEYANNFTLSWARHWGMQLKFVDRNTYRLREQAEFLQQLQQQFPNARIIPEGGSNTLALNGVGEIISELKRQTDFDFLLCPVGSGGTIAGLINAADKQHKVFGISVLKQDGYLEKQIQKLLGDATISSQWQLFNQYHCGGYGKFKDIDLQQMLEIQNALNIPLEPMYSGKLFIAFFDMLKRDCFPKGSDIVLLHTGGLQGLGGMAQRRLIKEEQWHIPAFPKTG